MKMPNLLTVEQQNIDALTKNSSADDASATHKAMLCLENDAVLSKRCFLAGQSHIEQLCVFSPVMLQVRMARSLLGIMDSLDGRNAGITAEMAYRADAWTMAYWWLIKSSELLDCEREEK